MTTLKLQNKIMSRGFVKEEDQEEAPMVPPRAALPAGITNYVTPKGWLDLVSEKESLEKERANIPSENETEHRRRLVVVNGKLNLLNERISSARVLDPKDQIKEEVRFGASVKIRFIKKDQIQEFQIVGVDEADVQKQKIAFTAPIARALTGKKVGDIVEFSLGANKMELEILSIDYK